MAKIGILTCSNATQDLGCSSVSCLSDYRKRKGTFSAYPSEEKLTLVGIINCPGCPTVIGSDKLLMRIRALTEFRLDAIHFSNCIKALCPFVSQYKKSLQKNFPSVDIVIGTHEEHISSQDFRKKVKKLLCQQRKTMVDVILDKD